jgi:hypothetical protein
MFEKIEAQYVKTKHSVIGVILNGGKGNVCLLTG